MYICEHIGEIALIALGVLLILQGTLPLRAGKLHFGFSICIALGAVCFVFALFSEEIHKAVPAWILDSLGTVFGASVVAFLAVSAFLFMRGAGNAVRYNEDVAVVLGASVHRGRLSAVLKSRLNGALQYAKKNPKALIVLSGGKGRGETVSEADAMARYLLTRGLDKGRILIENRSTNTRENFLYSKALLSARSTELHKIVFITSRFHVYRAAHKAKMAGICARGLGVRTPLTAVLPDYLRESLAVMRLWLLGY